MKSLTPTSCPSCQALPVRIHPLPRIFNPETRQFGYVSHIVKQHYVTCEKDDFRCRWCGSQWNERERLGLRAERLRF